MASIIANGINIEYDTAGDPANPPLLLIMGLGAQMIAWDDRLVRQLVDRGFYVIRFDNRDVGRSKWFDDAGVPDIAAAAAGGVAPTPAYLLTDMADDTVGLLSALEIPAAHVVGASMGGMIAQALAICHAPAVSSLVSIMSTTGDPAVGAPRPDVVEALFLAPVPADEAAFVDAAVKASQLIGSPGYPFHEDQIRTQAAVAYHRAFHPEGTARQLVAILATRDRTPDLRQLRIPTLVVHGEEDPLIDPSGGQATADAVPGAELWMVPGMGNDLPSELFGPLADRIAAHCLDR
jgi:pimeloyl-ACP methyl ester carboxylesterase